MIASAVGLVLELGVGVPASVAGIVAGRRVHARVRHARTLRHIDELERELGLDDRARVEDAAAAYWRRASTPTRAGVPRSPYLIPSSTQQRPDAPPLNGRKGQQGYPWEENT